MMVKSAPLVSRRSSRLKVMSAWAQMITSRRRTVSVWEKFMQTLQKVGVGIRGRQWHGGAVVQTLDECLF